MIRDLDKGDIIKLPWNVYCDFPTEHGQAKFGHGSKMFVVCDFPSNNGNFLARDLSCKYWFNTVTDDITLVKKKVRKQNVR